LPLLGSPWKVCCAPHERSSCQQCRPSGAAFCRYRRRDPAFDECEADRDEDELATRIQALGADRSRLADELDGSLVKSRKLERANREIAERLDVAIGTIRAVLGEGSKPDEDDDEEDADGEDE
jgi:hypothetical protein